jgi:hypothetical protein
MSAVLKLLVRVQLFTGWWGVVFIFFYKQLCTYLSP